MANDQFVLVVPVGLTIILHLSPQGDLAKALIYAAEAYHTRGAIRHIVGATQMKVESVESLSTEDLWVSMIENWGEANKEYHHCEESPLEVCLLKSSKYMWRMFSAMKFIRGRLPAEKTDGLVQFDAEDFTNPEYAAKVWMGYRKQGKREIPKDIDDVLDFFEQFECDSMAFGEHFSPVCISKMNDKVNAYNLVLASLVTDEREKPVGGGRGKGKGEGKGRGKGRGKSRGKGRGKGYGRKQDWAFDDDWGPGAFFKF